MDKIASIVTANTHALYPRFALTLGSYMDAFQTMTSVSASDAFELIGIGPLLNFLFSSSLDSLLEKLGSLRNLLLLSLSMLRTEAGLVGRVKPPIILQL